MVFWEIFKHFYLLNLPTKPELFRLNFWGFTASQENVNLGGFRSDSWARAFQGPAGAPTGKGIGIKPPTLSAGALSIWGRVGAGACTTRSFVSGLSLLCKFKFKFVSETLRQSYVFSRAQVMLQNSRKRFAKQFREILNLDGDEFVKKILASDYLHIVFQFLTFINLLTFQIRKSPYEDVPLRSMHRFGFHMHICWCICSQRRFGESDRMSKDF